MRITVESYDGHDLNDSSYRAYIPLDESAGMLNLADASEVAIARAGNFPSFAGKNLAGKSFVLSVYMLGTYSTQIDTLKQWFDTRSTTLKKLVISDPLNSDKQWYVMCACVKQPVIDGPTTEFVLYAPDPTLLSNTASTDSWSVTASGQTKALTVPGNVSAKPVITITPTQAKSGSYAYKRFLTVKNVTSSAFVDYPYDVLDNSLDGAALVTASKLQADGDDLRVFVDGAEVSRWLQDVNTTTAQCWINISLKPKQTNTLRTAIAGSGSITTIEFPISKHNDSFMSALPTRGILQVASELFTYTSVDKKKYCVNGVTRAAKGTSMAAHSIGDAVTWIEHDIWLMYGNSSVTAPTQDETKKPIIKLSSTNDSWIYEEFGDDANLRTGRWLRVVESSVGKASHAYSANQITYADPASEMGMRILAYQSKGKWMGETATISWLLSHPAGVTHVTSSGEYYRNTSSWPAVAGLFKKTSKWSSQWNLSSPTSVSSWTAFSKASEALGATYTQLMFKLSGSVSAVADGTACMEVADVTLTLASANRPTVAISSEQANYYLDLKLTNNTSGEFLSIQYMMALNAALTIDCAGKSITYADGTVALSSMTLSSVRQGWLDIAPGSNTLQYDDTGTAAVTVGFSWNDRNN
jgi:hypothetical protein